MRPTGFSTGALAYADFRRSLAMSRAHDCRAIELSSLREWELQPLLVFSLWREFGDLLCVENMDKRKPIGRTARELDRIFTQLPGASLCFDIGHARQCDPTMTEAYLILREFGSKLRQIHVSEVNTASKHDPLSYASIMAFQDVAHLIPDLTMFRSSSKLRWNLPAWRPNWKRWAWRFPFGVPVWWREAARRQRRAPAEAETFGHTAGELPHAVSGKATA